MIFNFDMALHISEFDKFGRFIESPCYGCNLTDCLFCDSLYEADSNNSFE